MRNVVFIALNKNVYDVSRVLFQRNNFFLKYLNTFCGYFVPKDDPKINVWITAGLYNKHNLMVYDKIDKAFLVVSEIDNIDSEFWNNLKISYSQLRKISKNICMISINIKKVEIKKSLLMWCIEHNDMEFIEDLTLDKLYF
jgi:hypothetical protein